jgi:hypothetical protein
VDNSSDIVENLGVLGITCGSISTKNKLISPYMGGIDAITGTFGLKVISSSAVELNHIGLIPVRIHKRLISAKDPDKP